ncbi:MAG TPA: type IV pilus secretin PilQ [Pyrinomonadaceae bacterium]|nr:type IV pilus secretin PilQ [Pyrinomonadaceae bacterium]
MSSQIRKLTAETLRGTLVLLCVFTLAAPPARAATAAARAAALSLRTTTDGAVTRITVEGTVPMAYAVSRPTERALLVELPGVDVSRLQPAYAVNSALVEAVAVEPQSSVGSLRSGALLVRLRSDARERTRIDGNSLVLELAPAPAAPDQQPQQQMQRPAPTPSPAPSLRADDSPATPAQQGQRYGQTGFVGEPISLNLVNADIRDILNYITEQYGVNFVIDRSVGAVPVTVNVSEVPWNLALDAILRANRLGIDVNGNILRVATQQVLADEAATQAKIADARLNSAPLVTEIFRLNYARASGTLAQAAGTTGDFAGGNTGDSFSGGSGGDSARGSADQGILPIIARRLSRRGSVEFDGRSNTLLVTDVRENIELNIRPLIALLDQPEPQVEIETRIVIATRNFSRDLGVQLSGGVFSTPRFDADGRFVGGGALGNINSITPITNPTSGPVPGGVFGGLANTIAPGSGLRANVPSTVVGLTTGLLGTAQISLAITAAETKGQAKVVATPRLTVLNNRPGQIESGSQIPVVTPQTGGGGSASEGGVVFTTTFVSVPIRLSVTPQITDAGTVILRVIAESNTVDRSLTNALGTPGIDTQRMQTEVLVPDGGTTVVGGVLNDSEGETQNRTPGLSGIPVIGNLFKRKATVRNTNEVLFFITPRIYRPDYNGRPTSGTVSNSTRTATVPQPVPLGNPQTNTPSPAQQQQPSGPAAQPPASQRQQPSAPQEGAPPPSQEQR